MALAELIIFKNSLEDLPSSVHSNDLVLLYPSMKTVLLRTSQVSCKRYVLQGNLAASIYTRKCRLTTINPDFQLGWAVLAECRHLGTNHGLRTPNEGISQRNLKFWVDVADKIRFGRT